MLQCRRGDDNIWLRALESHQAGQAYETNPVLDLPALKQRPEMIQAAA